MISPIWMAVIVVAYFACIVVDICEAEVFLRGAGASFPAGVYNAWLSMYKGMRSERIDLLAEYDSVGSTEGKRRIMSSEWNMKLEYAASDEILTPEEREEFPDLANIPTMAGAVVIGYNLPEIDDTPLVLSLDHLVGIYNGTFRWWNDTVFRDLNPTALLPNRTIVVLARADGSGTTGVFTEALSLKSAWGARYGKFDNGVSENSKWKDGVIAYSGYKSRGMAGMILSFPYSIGYLSLSDAKVANLKYCKMQNAFGTVVEASAASVQAAVDAWAKTENPNLTHSLIKSGQAKNSYPMASFTYFILRMTTMTNCPSALELVRYIDWFLHDPAAQIECESRQMASLSDAMASLVLDIVVKKIYCRNKVVWDLLVQEYERESEASVYPWLTPLVSVLGTISLPCLCFVAYLVRKRILQNKELAKDDWLIAIEDVIFCYSAKAGSRKANLLKWPSLDNFTPLEDLESGFDILKEILQWPARYNGIMVGLRLVEFKHLNRINRATKLELLSMKYEIQHQNILAFHGLTRIDNDWYCVSDYCTRGTLHEMLVNDSIPRNINAVNYSLLMDIIQGLHYLHSKKIIHGTLSSHKCLVDTKWTIKLVDWEIVKIYESSLRGKVNPYKRLHKTSDDVPQNEVAFQHFWTAPEILISNYDIFPCSSCDIYSYGITVQEIITHDSPYRENADTMTEEEILKAILDNDLRPRHPDMTPSGVRQMMDLAWDSRPSRRPTSAGIIKTLRESYDFKKGIVDVLLESMDEETEMLKRQISVLEQRIAVAGGTTNVAAITQL